VNNLPIRQDSRGMTQFVLKVPYQLRLRLHAASQATGASQQSIVRAAISAYVETLRPTPERPVLIPPMESEASDQVDQATEEPSTQMAPAIVDQVTDEPSTQTAPEMVQPKRRRRSR
jgi:hypothetical protein